MRNNFIKKINNAIGLNRYKGLDYYNAILGIAGIIVIIFFAFYSYIHEKEKSFEGKVSRKEILKNNIKILYINYDSKQVEVEIEDSNIYNKINILDCIIKRSGSFDYFLIQNDDTTVFQK